MSTIFEEPETALPVQAEQLFDTNRYMINRASLKFSGNVSIDLSDDRYVELFHGLKPGVNHKLTVEVLVTQYATKFGEDDGEAGNGGTKSVAIHTLYLPGEE